MDILSKKQYQHKKNEKTCFKCVDKNYSKQYTRRAYKIKKNFKEETKYTLYIAYYEL